MEATKMPPYVPEEHISYETRGITSTSYITMD